MEWTYLNEEKGLFERGMVDEKRRLDGQVMAGVEDLSWWSMINY